METQGIWNVQISEKENKKAVSDWVKSQNILTASFESHLVAL